MPTVVLDNANRIFPWLKYLPQGQIEAFYIDFFAALEQTLQHKNWSTLERMIESWQATAEVLADAELTAALIAPGDVGDMENWTDVESSLFSATAHARA